MHSDSRGRGAHEMRASSLQPERVYVPLVLQDRCHFTYLLTYLLTYLTNKQEHDLKKVPRTAPFFSNKRVRPETAECQSRCYSINCLFLELHMFFLMLQFLWRSYNSPVRLLCYTILYSAMLCYAMIYYTLLYFTALYYAMLYYTILYYTLQY